MLSKIAWSNQHPLGRLGCAWRGRGERLIEPGPQVTIRKQIHPEQRDEIGQGPAERGFELQVLEHEQRDQSRPDLNMQRVGRGPYERLHSEILLEGLEQQLDLPACLVDPRDGGRSESKV